MTPEAEHDLIVHHARELAEQHPPMMFSVRPIKAQIGIDETGATSHEERIVAIEIRFFCEDAGLRYECPTRVCLIGNHRHGDAVVRRQLEHAVRKVVAARNARRARLEPEDTQSLAELDRLTGARVAPPAVDLAGRTRVDEPGAIRMLSNMASREYADVIERSQRQLAAAMQVPRRFLEPPTRSDYEAMKSAVVRYVERVGLPEDDRLLPRCPTESLAGDRCAFDTGHEGACSWLSRRRGGLFGPGDKGSA